jgi:tRNA pseudouridine13 synthase
MIIKQELEDFIVEEISDIALKEKAEYAVYKLIKVGHNTEHAIEILCEAFRIPRNNIKYAGTKDRIAKTTQYISIHKDNGKRAYDKNNIKIEFVGFIDEPLSLGTLKGNKFEITVREMTADESAAFEKHVQHKMLMMPNYFDEQRFSENNFDIGFSILRKNFKNAVELIVKSIGTYENAVKMHLENNQNDYVGAIKRIPKKILSMYLHSVQSLLFNNALTGLLKEHSKMLNAEYSVKEYSQGEFIFYNDPENYDKIPVKELQLIGFDTNLMNEHIIAQLKALGIDQRDFIIRAIPELSVEGSTRNCFVEIEDFSYEKIDEKTIKLKFFLQKGSYATIAVKGMLC